MSDDIEERPGGLAGAFLDMEDERQQAIADGRDTGDDVMPGMGEGAMTLRQALARGGAVTFATLAAIVAVDNLEAATMGTLSPDIRDSLGLSDGAIIFIVSASSAFLILGALPMGWLADRYRRGRIIGFTNLFFGIMTALDRAGDDRRRAVLRSARRRFDEVEHVHGAGDAARRHLPDHVARVASAAR